MAFSLSALIYVSLLRPSRSTDLMTTKYRTAAQVAEQRILELTATFTTTATMPNTKTIRVPHLGGIQAAYQMPQPYNPSLPTLVMVNSFTTSSELYRSQYANRELTDNMNLLAIELLGHGQTRVEEENRGVFTGGENCKLERSVRGLPAISNSRGLLVLIEDLRACLRHC